MDTLLADALRITKQDLDAAIQHLRIAVRKRTRVAEFSMIYLKKIRYAHELSEEGRQAGRTGQFWEPMMPMPINPGFVGLSAQEKFRREWLLETAPRAVISKAA